MHAYGPRGGGGVGGAYRPPCGSYGPKTSQVKNRRGTPGKVLVTRCSAPPCLQSVARTLGLDTDSSCTIWIVAEEGNPGNNWFTALTSHPPQGGTLGTFL